ncbi:MAG: hypothetical protein U5O39_11025 [Gammaproteobacteria bacterium]|nr:hypothetical protein [Gammaproteobacteria bacterium]
MAPSLEAFAKVIGNCMSEGVILIDEVDPLDLRASGDGIGNGVDLHSNVGVEAKMPEAAFLVHQ